MNKDYGKGTLANFGGGRDWGSVGFDYLSFFLPDFVNNCIYSYLVFYILFYSMNLFV